MAEPAARSGLSPIPPTMTQAEWDRITAPPRLIPDDVIRMFEKKP
jgi:hypothetical protein